MKHTFEYTEFEYFMHALRLHIIAYKTPDCIWENLEENKCRFVFGRLFTRVMACKETEATWTKL